MDVGQADSVTGRKGKRLIPSRWRACVNHVKSQLRISERNARRVLGQHRSAQRRLPVGRADEDPLVADMIELPRQYDWYAQGWIAASLRDAGWLVNDKHVERPWRGQKL